MERNASSQPRGRAQAYLALVVLAAFWGYAWVVVKIATLDGSPVAVATLRSALGAVALLGYLALTGRSLRPTPFWPTLGYGLLQTTAFTLVVTIAVARAGAGKTAVLAYTMPFWLALLAWPLLGERIPALRWLALAVAAVGLGLVVTPLESRSSLANVLGVLGGLVWAVSAIWALRLRASGYDLLSLTAWQMVWGSAALGVFALAMPGAVRLTVPFVLSIAFLAIFANAVGWALWLFVLSRLPAAAAGVASLATPLVGVVLAAVQLHEIPSARQLAGIGCIVVALALNARR